MAESNESKKVKLLFDESVYQCMHLHTFFSNEYHGAPKIMPNKMVGYAIGELDRLRKKSGNGTRLVMSITDHNTFKAYEKEQVVYKFDDINRAGLKGLGADVHVGMEMSALLKDSAVHVLVYDVKPEKFMFFSRSISDRTKIETVKSLSQIVHLCGGKMVLAHPSRQYRSGTPNELIPLKEVLQTAYDSKAFDGIEAATSNMDIDQIFDTLEFCIENNMPITVGTDFHFNGRASVKDMPRQRKDPFFLESLGVSCPDFSAMVNDKTINQLRNLKVILNKHVDIIKNRRYERREVRDR